MLRTGAAGRTVRWAGACPVGTRARFAVGLGIGGRGGRTLTALLAGRRAVGTRREEFVPCQLAIAILVECQQCRGSVCDLAGIDHAIVVGVERLDDGQWRWTMIPTLRTTLGTSRLVPTRSSLLVALWSARRAIRPRRPEFVCRQFAVVIFV